MTKLQVALCITELQWGGAEQCLVRLAIGMDRERLQPTVYCLAPPPRGDKTCLEPLAKAGITIHFLGAKSKWQLPLIVRRLANLWRRNRPDVVQSFLFHANAVAACAAHRAGIHAVVSGIRVAERRSALPFLVDRCLDRWVSRYVCVSRSVADFYNAKTGIDREKLLVIPNGIELSSYQPQISQTQQSLDLSGLGISPQRRFISFVGRLDPQKGVDWLVATAGDWLDKLPQHDLLVVGDGSRRRELEIISGQNTLAGRIHFTGRRDDVPAILARSELLVLPSLWEGMPNVVMEAMAAGLPVVATKVEGVEELLGPAADPQTVAYGDTRAFAAKIIAFAANPQYALEIGQKNRARVEQNFSLSKMIFAYQKLWESIADKR